ncbi:MAG: homoserine dehydrogenase [Alphaproteobacteria bacterium]|nr:homoserine dehydrogenase [Alphaproteobacteria bacterium]
MGERQASGEAEKRICVLKFGSSVLGVEEDFPSAALEIYRHVRDGEKVVAVVSALAGETDSLLGQAERVGGEGDPALVARVARVGELHSAGLMALALGRLGLRACTLDPHEMGLVAEGEPLDSDLVALDAAIIHARLDSHEVVVVPGFTAVHREHGVVTLGRGGTDLSAVFFAARLDAHRVRLIKDVDGVYAEDPAKNPYAERYLALDYDLAAEVSAGPVQPKAIHAAKVENVLIEVASLGAGEATTIADVAARKALPARGRKLRVALLGCGAVGAGVLAHFNQWADLFELNPVLVRDPSGRAGGSGRFTADVEAALAGADLIVETMGGADFAADLLCPALRSGVHVVTANKAAVAKHYEALHACAKSGGAMLAYSAAVGGGVPILEALARLDGVVEVEGVMNGTVNYLLGRLAEGWRFDEALARAQELGFAEADPSADVDGDDAADKLSILVREALHVPLPPSRIGRQSLRDIPGDGAAQALARGETLKQVGRCRLLPGGGVEAEVRIVSLPLDHPLAGARNEENRFTVRTADGKARTLCGKGAGRWPTAASVFADVMDIQRALVLRSGDAQASEPALLRA